ncbi:uncharacterized protein OCT59_025541 [Rhizophagus irregularis]|uniref:uncharacterized protein n=1 Tax=Rhizophagus irregularis TaxID=588596 RepID=UPI0033301237|nr:hypothetical protein OCT59_025541 [Rhizophagus irregularis]
MLKETLTTEQGNVDDGAINVDDGAINVDDGANVDERRNDQHPAFGYNKPGLLKIDSYLIDNMKQKNVKTSFNNNSREGTHEYPSLPSGDLRLSSKSEIESFDDENEIYGIIPYVAPEVIISRYLHIKYSWQILLFKNQRESGGTFCDFPNPLLINISILVLLESP